MGWTGPMTHRQFVAWLVYMNEAADNPTIDQFYMMQIGCEIRRILYSFRKGAKKVDVNDLKLKFSRKGSKGQGQTPITKEQAAAWSKARWGARLGRKINPQPPPE